MRMLRRITLADWPAQDRSTLCGAALVIVLLAVEHATVRRWGFISLAVPQAFHASAGAEVMLRQVPDIVGLFSVLAVGAFGPQFSASRLMSITAVTAFVGALFMLFAPSYGWLILGLSLLSVGRSVVGVAAFAAIGATIKDQSRRISAFAIIGGAAPAASIICPVLAGAMLGVGGWRKIGILWMVSALVLALAGWLMRRPTHEPQIVERREPWTPILGGITLVGMVWSLRAITSYGHGSFVTMVWIAGTLAAASACFMLTRVLSNPTIDGRTLRVPGLIPTLLITMIGHCGELWFYVAAFARFVHQLSALQVTLTMIVPQLAGLGGACLASWLIRRAGLRSTGTLLLALYSGTMFLSCTTNLTNPLWIVMAILCVAAVAEIGVSVCLSQAIMSCAPPGKDRIVSSYRMAANGVGNALALLLVASSVGRTMSVSMRQAEDRHVASAMEEALVEAIRDNVPTTQIGRDLELSEAQLQDLRGVRRDVIVDGFRAHGLVSGSVLAVAAVGFWVVGRRDKRAEIAAG